MKITQVDLKMLHTNELKTLKGMVSKELKFRDQIGRVIGRRNVSQVEHTDQLWMSEESC